MPERAVFLDRDGVVVREIVRDNVAYAPTELADFQIVPEAPEQVARLRAAGFLRIVFTNQPEVAKGLLAPSTLTEMHLRLRASVDLDEIAVCPHDGQESDPCVCRKPAPGLLLEAMRRWDIDLSASYVVGDRWRDIGAGQAVGCFSILIDRPYSQCTTADARVTSLTEAVDLILIRSQGAQHGIR